MIFNFYDFTYSITAAVAERPWEAAFDYLEGITHKVFDIQDIYLMWDKVLSLLPEGTKFVAPEIVPTFDKVPRFFIVADFELPAGTKLSLNLKFEEEPESVEPSCRKLERIFKETLNTYADRQIR